MSVRPTRAAITAVVLAIVLAIGFVPGSPAGARTDNRSKAVLFIHGYNPTSNSTDCGGDFDAMISQLRSQGFIDLDLRRFLAR